MARAPGDHGKTTDALDFALDWTVCDDSETFLRCWREGDLKEWPEFYTWLAVREAAQTSGPSLEEELRPPVSLLCKLGSIAVHAAEYIGPHGHEFDRNALESALNDPEVKAWLDEMGKVALIPLMRNKP